MVINPIPSNPGRFLTDVSYSGFPRKHLIENMEIYFYKIYFDGRDFYKYFISIKDETGGIFALKIIPFVHDKPEDVFFEKNSLGEIKVRSFASGAAQVHCLDSIIRHVEKGLSPGNEIKNDLRFGRKVDASAPKVQSAGQKVLPKISAGDGTW